MEERRTQLFDAPAVNAEIIIPGSRSGTNGNKPLRSPQLELQVIDKTKYRTATLQVEITGLFSDDDCAR